MGRVDLASRDDEMQVNASEHPRFFFRAFSIDLDRTIAHVLTRLPEDCDDIVSAAAAGAQEQDFHRARTEIAATTFYGAIHDESVAAFTFTNERGVVDPFDCSFHRSVFSQQKWNGGVSNAVRCCHHFPLRNRGLDSLVLSGGDGVTRTTVRHLHHDRLATRCSSAPSMPLNFDRDN